MGNAVVKTASSHRIAAMLEIGSVIQSYQARIAILGEKQTIHCTSNIATVRYGTTLLIQRHVPISTVSNQV